MNRVLHCAIYTRKSSEEGLEQSFNSLDAQREACEAYIKSQAHEGWRLIKTAYDDGGYSGGSMERPALHRLLQDIDRGKVHVVVVYKVDRLTRSLADFAKIIERFDARRVSFVSVTQSFNTTTSMGRLTLNVLLSFAQFEREVTGERIRDKIAASRKKGLWMGGTPPLGYDVKDRKLVVNEDEAERVRAIFRLYVERGCVSALQTELSRRGMKSKQWTSQKGRAWGGAVLGRGALYQMLQNEIYIGKAVHKGTAYPGNHEPIVSQALWDKVQTVLHANRVRRQDSVMKSGRLLTGLLFDEDGNRMSPSSVRNRHGRQYAYYVSQPTLQDERKRVASVTRIAAGDIETFVESKIGELLRKPASRSNDLDASDQADSIRTLVRRIRIARDNVTIQIIDQGDIDPFKIKKLEIVSDAEGRVGDGAITVRVPVRFGRRGTAHLFEAGSDGQTYRPARPDRALIKAVVRAYAWRTLLEDGVVSSTRELADRAGCHVRYVRNLIKLAFFSPDLMAAIVDGRPLLANLAELMSSSVPLSWVEQGHAYGTSARGVRAIISKTTYAPSV